MSSSTTNSFINLSSSSNGGSSNNNSSSAITKATELSSLHLLCYNGEVDKIVSVAGNLDQSKIIELLLEKDEDNRTPLHYCVYASTKESLTCLNYFIPFCSSYEVNVKDNNGITPLHMAAFRNNLDAMKLLCEQGGNLFNRGIDIEFFC